jgi:hypothetical protein
VVTLPYSPEHAPRALSESGSRILSNVAEMTGGTSRIDALEIFNNPPRAAGMHPLGIWLLATGIALLLVEIAGRRLSLWSKPAHAGETTEGGLTGWRSWLPKLPARGAKPKRQSAVPQSQRAVQQPSVSAPVSQQPASTPASEDIFRQAKNRAKRRLNE